MESSPTPFSSPLFPGTLAHPFLITSPPAKNYNCIAWACEDSSAWYWPDPDHNNFWPDNVPREVTLGAFQLLFEHLGYEACLDDSLEKRFQKIAIYSDSNNTPTHAARQLPNGNWTSKLGSWYDVAHTVQNMDNGQYGKVAIIMRKKSGSQV